MCQYFMCFCQTWPPFHAPLAGADQIHISIKLVLRLVVERAVSPVLLSLQVKKGFFYIKICFTEKGYVNHLSVMSVLLSVSSTWNGVLVFLRYQLATY